VTSDPITVVKLGGSLLENPETRARALAAVAARVSSGERIVLVHGGGKRIDSFLGQLGIPKKVHEGLRVTDERTLDVVVAVLAGLVNKLLVVELRALGVRAAGCSGADADTLWAEFHPRQGGVDLGYVGQVTFSDPTLITAILGAGLLPVFASVAVGRDGTLLNVNADAAAAALAKSLHAARLVFFTDVEGVKDADGNVLPEITPERTRALLASPAVTGGMRPKLVACLDAVAGGVGEVLIAGPGRHSPALSIGQGGTRLAA
jgi:acetylglutamate kinase